MIHVILDSDCCDGSACLVSDTTLKKVWDAFVNGVVITDGVSIKHLEPKDTVPPNIPQLKVAYKTVPGGIEVKARLTHRGWFVKDEVFRKTN